jgi:hypothetical protein
MTDEITPVSAPSIDLTAENSFSKLFEGAQSASGDQELLKVAADFASQYSGEQMKILCFIHGLVSARPDSNFAKKISPVLAKYVEYKRNHDSAMYVMAALDSIALRKFVNENTMKVNIMK